MTVQDEAALFTKLNRLLELLAEAKARESKTDDKQPRSVVEKTAPIEIVKLSPKVEQFFSKLLAGITSTTEKPEEIKNKTGFWRNLLTLIGTAIVGVYLYWKDVLWPLFEEVGSFLKRKLLKLWTWLKEVKELLKGKLINLRKWLADFSFEKMLKPLTEFFGRNGPVARLFAEEGALARLFKGTAVERLILRIRKFLSEEGPIAKLFGEGGPLSKLFKDGSIVSKFRKWITTGKWLTDLGKAVVDTQKLARTVLKPIGNFFRIVSKALRELVSFAKHIPGVEKLLKVIGKAGKFLSRFAVVVTPLTALADGFDAYNDEMKRSGDVYASQMKGILAWSLKVLTLGLVDFEDIESGLNAVVDAFKTDDWLDTISRVLLLIPEAIIKAPLGLIKTVMEILETFGIVKPETVKSFKDFIKKIDFNKWLTDAREGLGTFFEEVTEKYLESYYAIEEFFCVEIPDAIQEIADSIFDVFDKIVNFDYKGFLEDKIPGLKKFKSLFNFSQSTTQAEPPPQSKPRAEPPPQSKPQVAQDFISRPGQVPMQFASVDTVLGMKSGGPLEKVLLATHTSAAEIGRETKELLERQNRLIENGNEIFMNILQAVQEKHSNVVISNNTRNTRFSLGEMGGSTSFRSGAAT